MITLTQGQQLKDNQDLFVLSPSGDYDENDLILCAPEGATEATCQFEAQYVKNGNSAYDNTIIPT